MFIILLFSDCNMIAEGKQMQRGLKTGSASGCLSKCLGSVIKAFAVKTVQNSKPPFQNQYLFICFISAI